MKVAILQPGYLPWLGFFDQLARVDTFVLYDDVQFTRRDWRSRNRIKTPGVGEGWQWLSVPVKNRGNYHSLIHEIEVDYEQNWVRKHLGAIKAHYGKAPFFKTYFGELEALLEARPARLVDLDVSITRRCAEWLGIATPMVFSSTLTATGESTARLVAICRELGATSYLSGNAAQDYLDESLFAAVGISVEWQNYVHPTYQQQGGDFLPFMCILDLLLNCGPESLGMLRK
ncbi:MAG: WbqC family protein [Blastocatellia bacterium]|nr:WbqC family protein [Blastocatellia bacterium]